MKPMADRQKDVACESPAAMSLNATLGKGLEVVQWL